MKRLMVTTGFVTNSSSMICGFDRALLEDEEVQAFLTAFEISEGYIGKDLWHRGECGSILLTEAQKEQANADLAASDYGHVSVGDPKSPEVVVIYGDEYEDLAAAFAHLLYRVADRKSKEDGRSYESGGWEYN